MVAGFRLRPDRNAGRFTHKRGTTDPQSGKNGETRGPADFEDQIRLARAAETEACRKYFGHVNTRMPVSLQIVARHDAGCAKNRRSHHIGNDECSGAEKAKLTQEPWGLSAGGCGRL